MKKKLCLKSKENLTSFQKQSQITYKMKIGYLTEIRILPILHEATTVTAIVIFFFFFLQALSPSNFCL